MSRVRHRLVAYKTIEILDVAIANLYVRHQLPVSAHAHPERGKQTVSALSDPHTHRTCTRTARKGSYRIRNGAVNTTHKNKNKKNRTQICLVLDAYHSDRTLYYMEYHGDLECHFACKFRTKLRTMFLNYRTNFVPSPQLSYRHRANIVSHRTNIVPTS